MYSSISINYTPHNKTYTYHPLHIILHFIFSQITDLCTIYRDHSINIYWHNSTFTSDAQSTLSVSNISTSPVIYITGCPVNQYNTVLQVYIVWYLVKHSFTIQHVDNLSSTIVIINISNNIHFIHSAKSNIVFVSFLNSLYRSAHFFNSMFWHV